MTEKTKTDAVGLAQGTKVGKYTIEHRIAVGGQAVVYKAHDVLLDRHVAIKQISTHLAADEKFMERFRKEAQILAKLGAEQESIVTIHELLEDERGLFIVMEYLPGSSLEKVLEDTKGPSEVKATLQIVWRLAAALHAVHHAGIIHRDLKPANILIAEGLRPKIADFGVAATSGDASMTLGTTKYMAPELYGERSKVDGRVDMYSLGFIAYELLVGRPKFEEIFAEVVRDKHGEQLRWMKWHGNESVEAPRVHEVNPAVPESLSDIVARMMAKDPDKRYANMEDLGRAIKTTFSPRAKAAGGAAAPHARPKRRPHPPKRRPKPSLSASDSGMALVPPDAGDELEIHESPTGPATAPLPSARTGRKVLLFVVLPLLLLGIITGGVIGVIGVVNRNSERDRVEKIISSKWLAAEKAMDVGVGKGTLRFDDAKLAEAAAGFKEIAEKYPDAKAAKTAQVYLVLCEGYRAVIAGDWDKAITSKARAVEMIKKLQQQDLVSRAWTTKAKSSADNLGVERLANQSYRDAESKARALLHARRYQEARDALDEVPLKDLTGQLLKERDLLLAEINAAEVRGMVRAQINKADLLREQVRLDEAEAAYELAQDMLGTDRAKALPTPEVQAFQEEIGNKVRDLTSNRSLNDARMAVQKARSGGDKEDLITALRRLDRIEPSQANKEEIRTLQSQVELAKGRQAKAEGNISAAEGHFRNSIQIKDNPEAKAELAMIAEASKRAGLVKAGDAAFAAGRWPDALAKYEEAGKLAMDEVLSAKIVECRFRIKFAEAETLRRQRDYPKAIAAYDEAVAIKPSAASRVSIIKELMAADEQYSKVIAEARAALDKKQWAQARKLFTDAGKVRSTAEVAEGVRDTRYGENFAKGSEAMDGRRYGEAKAYFNLAKDFKDTAEVREAIRKAEDALKEEQP